MRNLGAVGTVAYTPPGAQDIHQFEVSVSWREAGEDADSSYAVRVEL
jgi:hypothetical protein